MKEQKTAKALSNCTFVLELVVMTIIFGVNFGRISLVKNVFVLVGLLLSIFSIYMEILGRSKKLLPIKAVICLGWAIIYVLNFMVFVMETFILLKF